MGGKGEGKKGKYEKEREGRKGWKDGNKRGVVGTRIERREEKGRVDSSTLNFTHWCNMSSLWGKNLKIAPQ